MSGGILNAYTDEDKLKLGNVEIGAQVNPDASTIKTQYESNVDTNAYTDAEKTKLLGIETGAETNNISDIDATDLTDGGETTLHTHPGAGGTTERLHTIRTLTLVTDGNEQIIAFDSAQTDITAGFTVNAGGTITTNVDGYYEADLSLYIDKSGGAAFNFALWVERKPFATGIWELNDGAKASPIVYDDGGQALSFGTHINALAGDEWRIMTKKNSGTASFVTVSQVVALGTIAQPAASLAAHRIGPVNV